MRRFLTVFMFGLFCLGVATACTTQSEPDETGLESSTASPQTSATTAPTTVTTLDTQPTEDDFEALAQLWEQFLDAAGQPVEERQGALENIETLTPEVLEVGLRILRPIDLTADAYTYPNFTQQSDGTIFIDDCTLYQPAIQESVTHHHNATAQQDNNGNWTITGISLQSRRCVPAQIALPALQGFEAFDQARRNYWDPPNPDHPDIEQTLTGDLLIQTPQNIRNFIEDGAFLAVVDEGAAEVVDVFARDRISIASCRTINEETGIFDIETREPIEGVQPVAGDVYRSTVEMWLEDGKWKAAEADSEITQCQQVPTPAGLRVIGE